MVAMTEQIKDVLMGRIAFIASVLWVVAVAVSYAWPTSWWMEVNSVHVADSKVGQPIVMVVDRKINRAFIATWGVNVRVVSVEGSHVECAASALSSYVAGSEIPHAVDLGWWTNNQCKTLPVGSYVVHTTWVINGIGPLPDKEIKVASNIFKVQG